jgi:fatty-acyl-CoA synthase
MASPVRQFDAIADEERLLDLVRALVSELGHQPALASVRAGAHLERELGLGSLERVELLLRIEQAFGTRLDDRVLAEADTVQDVISALSVATEAPLVSASGGLHASLEAFSVKVEPAPASRADATAHARRISSGEIAEGLPTAETFQDVLRYRGRADAAKTHLIFFADEGESPALTFGALLAGAERVAAELAQRGIGRGDSVAIMLPTSSDFFLAFAGALLAGATPVPIYPPFRADRIAEYAERQSAILTNAGARLLVTFREAERVAKLL